MGKSNVVTVSVRPRIHLGLISLHAGGPRKNGGVGFAIGDPGAQVRLSRAERFVLEDHRERPLAEAEATRLARSVAAAIEGRRLPYNVKVSVSGRLGTHIGMGSGTAVTLAVLEGLFALNGCEISQENLVMYSRRGGTSGIGIHTYFSGGLVLDLGVPNDGSVYLPSSSVVPTRTPLALPAVPLPSWTLCLCLPVGIRPKSEEEEREFFRESLPITAERSFEASYHAAFGVYAGAVEGDWRGFCAGIDALQTTRWKQMEWRQYGPRLAELACTLRDLGASCVGLSSMGPMVFCFGTAEVAASVSARSEQLGCDVTVTEPWNSGRTVEYTG